MRHILDLLVQLCIVNDDVRPAGVDDEILGGDSQLTLELASGPNGLGDFRNDFIGFRS